MLQLHRTTDLQIRQHTLGGLNVVGCFTGLHLHMSLNFMGTKVEPPTL